VDRWPVAERVVRNLKRIRSVLGVRKMNLENVCAFLVTIFINGSVKIVAKRSFTL
jgi:hypothetical protein